MQLKLFIETTSFRYRSLLFVSCLLTAPKHSISCLPEGIINYMRDIRFCLCLISIPLFIFQEHERGQHKRHQLRRRSRQPDTVHAKKQRKHDHGDQHKNKRSGKCKHGRNDPVGQCGKHPAGKNIKSDKEKRHRTDPVPRYRQFVHRIIRPGKYRYQRSCQHKGGGNRDQADTCDHFQTRGNQLFQFLVILFPVVITQHGRHTV